MPNIEILSRSESGRRLVDSIEIPEATLNLLFAALLTTAISAFIVGNLLLLDASVLQFSGPIALACLAILLIFYTLARSLGSVTWGLVITYVLIWVMVYGRQPWLISLAYAFAAFGFLYTIRFLRVARRQWWVVLLMGVIGTATVFSSSWAFTSFDILLRLHSGYIHIDALFHSSISAMIKHYGVISTGLHGLVEFQYHTLSHTLMAGISLLSGYGTLEVYGVARPMLFASILIFSVVTYCIMLDRMGKLSIPIAWSLVCILLVVFPRLLTHPRWPWDVYFISEPYLVSLGLFLLGLPLLFKARLVILDLFLVLLLAALISNAKISVGAIYAGLWLTRLIFIRGERPVLEWIATLSTLVVTAFVILHSTGVGWNSWTAISPLAFLRTYWFGSVSVSEVIDAIREGSSVSWRTLALASMATLGFFVFHFSLSWIVIGWVAYTKGAPALLKEPVAIYTSAVVIPCIVLVLLFSMSGQGTIGYFLNVVFFVALPVVVALLTQQVGHWPVPRAGVLLFGIVIIVVWSLESYYVVSALWPGRSHQQPSPFIASLTRVRDTLPINVVMKPDPSLLKNNPVLYCVGQPLAFPAASERPWIDVVPVRDDCYFFEYGYGKYGITESQRSVTVKAQLLPGMATHHWPPVPKDVDPRHRVPQE